MTTTELITTARVVCAHRILLYPNGPVESLSSYFEEAAEVWEKAEAFLREREKHQDAAVVNLARMHGVKEKQ